MSVIITPKIKKCIESLKNISVVTAVEVSETNDLIDKQIDYLPSYIFEMTDGENVLNFVIPKSFFVDETVLDFDNPPAQHIIEWFKIHKNSEDRFVFCDTFFLDLSQNLIPLVGGSEIELTEYHKNLISVLLEIENVSNVKITRIIDDKKIENINNENHLLISYNYIKQNEILNFNTIIPDGMLLEDVVKDIERMIYKE